MPHLRSRKQGYDAQQLERHAHHVQNPETCAKAVGDKKIDDLENCEEAAASGAVVLVACASTLCKAAGDVVGENNGPALCRSLAGRLPLV
jgi:hypothetical protein